MMEVTTRFVLPLDLVEPLPPGKLEALNQHYHEQMEKLRADTWAAFGAGVPEYRPCRCPRVGVCIVHLPGCHNITG